MSAKVAKEITAQYQGVLTQQRVEISSLKTELDTQSKTLKFISGSNLVTGKKPVPVVVTNGSPRVPSPPLLTGIRIASQKQIPSDDPHFPYGLEVVV